MSISGAATPTLIDRSFVIYFSTLWHFPLFIFFWLQYARFYFISKFERVRFRITIIIIIVIKSWILFTSPLTICQLCDCIFSFEGKLMNDVFLLLTNTFDKLALKSWNKLTYRQILKFSSYYFVTRILDLHEPYNPI